MEENCFKNTSWNVLKKLCSQGFSASLLHPHEIFCGIEKIKLLDTPLKSVDFIPARHKIIPTHDNFSDPPSIFLNIVSLTNIFL